VIVEILIKTIKINYVDFCKLKCFYGATGNADSIPEVKINAHKADKIYGF